MLFNRQTLIFGTGLLLTAAFFSCSRQHGNEIIGSGALVGPVPVVCNPVATPFGGGTGTPSDPFAICSESQLSSVGAATTGSHFVMAANLDLSSNSNFTPVSVLDGFLDGNRHTISGLTQSGMTYGLFNSINTNAELKDLGLSNVNLAITVNASSGIQGGGLAINNQGTITGCFVKGTLNPGTASVSFVGGLVSENDGVIQDSYTNISVTNGGFVVGGIASSEGNGSIVRSYSVASNLSSANQSGGLVGSTGFGTQTANDSFWDSTVSGVTTDASTGTRASKTTAEMKTAATFSGAAWSSGVWILQDGAYPKFIWE